MNRIKPKMCDNEDGFIDVKRNPEQLIINSDINGYLSLIRPGLHRDQRIDLTPREVEKLRQMIN